jgi:Uma2 family endonuclease
MLEAGPVIETKVDRETYLRLAMDEPDRRWELVDGRLREKPGMAFRHNRTGRKLGHFLLLQLDSEALPGSGRCRSCSEAGVDVLHPGRLRVAVGARESVP